MLRLQSQATFSIRYIDGDILWLERLMTRPNEFIDGVMVLCWIIGKIGWLYGVVSDIRTVTQLQPEPFRHAPYTALEFGVMIAIIKLVSLRWGIFGN